MCIRDRYYLIVKIVGAVVMVWAILSVLEIVGFFDLPIWLMVLLSLLYLTVGRYLEGDDDEDDK